MAKPPSGAPVPVRTVLIPVDAGNLLLPNAAVAEVIAFHDPEPVRNAPGWLLGIIFWRQQSVLLTSFSAMAGREVDRLHRRSRIVVCNSVAGYRGLSFFGIVAKAIPQLVRPDSQILPDTNANGLGGPPVLMHVNVAGEPAVIPDFDAVEEKLGNYAAGLQF